MTFAAIIGDDAIENTLQLARFRKRPRAPEDLLIMIMAILACECRRLPLVLARQVLAEVSDCRGNWDIRFLSWIIIDPPGT